MNHITVVTDDLTAGELAELLAWLGRVHRRRHPEPCDFHSPGPSSVVRGPLSDRDQAEPPPPASATHGPRTTDHGPKDDAPKNGRELWGWVKDQPELLARAEARQGPALAPPDHRLDRPAGARGVRRAERASAAGSSPMGGRDVMTHPCLWPGCPARVQIQLLMCRAHWFALPKRLRDPIRAAYRPGQEVDFDPSDAYMDAPIAVRDWIARTTHEDRPR